MNFNTITVEKALKVIWFGVNRLEKGSELEILKSDWSKKDGIALSNAVLKIYKYSSFIGQAMS